MGQTLIFLFMRDLPLGHHSLRFRRQFLKNTGGNVFADTTPFRIEPRLCLRRLPPGGKNAVAVIKIGFYNIVCYRFKIIQLPLSSDYKRQCRRFYAADGIDAPIALTAGSQRIGTRQVHSHQPIGAAARQSRIF